MTEPERELNETVLYFELRIALDHEWVRIGSSIGTRDEARRPIDVNPIDYAIAALALLDYAAAADDDVAACLAGARDDLDEAIGEWLS